MGYDIVSIFGPTACGKTSVATALARRLGKAEIISADSRQVFRGMDIGTGKDLDEYEVDGVHIPYHLIDIAEAGEKYSVFEFQRDFFQAYADIRARGHFPILCGGTGLYIESVLRNYSLVPVPENPQRRAQLETMSMKELTALLASMKRLHNVTDTDTKRRVIRAIEIEEYYREHHLDEQRSSTPISSLNICMNIDRETRRERISYRLKKRIDEGMVDEVNNLLTHVPAERLISYGLEYRYITLYLTGQISYDEMYTRLEIAIHQFAKRQMTWFRGMEHRGVNIHWIDATVPLEERVGKILQLMADDESDN